jgi:Ras-related protein Rab-1A
MAQPRPTPGKPQPSRAGGRPQAKPKEDYELYKILIIGDSGVGKSSLMLRYVDETFSDSYVCTIGVDFKIKTLLVGETLVKLQIWDTAGQDRFKAITASYYRGSHGIILVYDVTNPITFTHVETWLEEVNSTTGGKVTKLLVGNKCDLDQQRAVDYNTAKAWADNLKIPFIEASAKSAENVEKAFLTMATDIQNRLRVSKTEGGTDKVPTVSVGSGATPGQQAKPQEMGVCEC